MSAEPISMVFVSGKGGVGKTILAANFAWVCSQIAKTAIIDLDFQNQGCTGLFVPHVKLGQGNALEAIKNPGDHASQELNQVAERLYFLPAVSWQQRPPQEEIARYINVADFQSKLLAFIEQLKLRQGFNIVVLDCHGGLDAVSVAAFQSCDYTLMVTEADSVTFAGTLELLSYYETRSAETHSMGTSKESPARSQGVPNATDLIQISPCVKFIVNRIPSKYRWKDLERIYKGYISKKLGIFTHDRSIFCYIPSEELLAESFGEYPFHGKLAPKSIFSKKIHYMAYSLLDGNYDIPSRYKPLTKFRKRRYMRKIERLVVSNEFKNTDSILKFFAWISILYLVSIPVIIGILPRPALINRLKEQPYLSMLIVIGAAVFGSIFWYFLRAEFGLMFLYRNKYKFQKALFRAVAPKLSLWQRLSLAKLLVMRIGTTIFPYLVVLYLVALIIALAIPLILPFLR